MPSLASGGLRPGEIVLVDLSLQNREVKPVCQLLEKLAKRELFERTIQFYRGLLGIYLSVHGHASHSQLRLGHYFVDLGLETDLIPAVLETKPFHAGYATGAAPVAGNQSALCQ